MSKAKQTQQQPSGLSGGLMHKRAVEYVKTWKTRGYPEDIPDEVPACLMTLGLAPSYKAICFAILSNDHSMEALGFTASRSVYYDVLKRIEFESREK